MRGAALWIAKAVFSAAFWFGALYLAMGLFFGDRVTELGIVGPALAMPPWLFVGIALVVYALCSVAWDRTIGRGAEQAAAIEDEETAGPVRGIEP